MKKFWKKGACIDQKKNDAAEPDDLAQRGFLDFFAQGLVFGVYVLAQIMDFMAYIIDFIRTFAISCFISRRKSSMSCFVSLRKSAMSCLVATSEDSYALRTATDIALACSSGIPASSSVSTNLSVSKAACAIDQFSLLQILPRRCC